MRWPLILVVMCFSPVLKAAVSRAPAQVSPQVEQRIDSLIAANKTSKAVSSLQAALREHPDWQPGLWRLGNLLYGADRFSLAKEVFDKLIKLDVKQGAPWALLGFSDLALHDYDAAADHIQHGLALGFPAELNLAPAAYQQLSLAMLMTGRFDKALAILTGSVVDPDGVKAQQTAAGLAALRIAALPQDAQRLLPPGREAVLEQLGELEIGTARSNEGDAKKRWESLVKADDDLPGIHAAFGKYLLTSGDASSAIPEFRAELERSKTDVNALLGLGFALMEAGDLDSSNAACAQALQLDPNNANGHYLISMLAIKRGDFADALEQLKASRDLDPNLSRVHYALSQVYLKLGKPEDAAREAKMYQSLKVAEENFRETGRLPVPADAGAGQ